MKIGIDVFGCNHARSGVGSYLLNILSNLPLQDDLSIELFGPEIDRYTYNSENELPFISLPIADSLTIQRNWHRRKIKKFLKKKKYDIVLFPAPDYVIPKNYKHKNVIVVNTTITNVLKTEKKIYIHQMKKGFQYATKIIASSEYIKQDLINYGISSKKIVIIQNGIDHKLFFPTLNFTEEIVKINPFAIKRPYFIYATRLSEEGKNHLSLIKAFEIFKENTGYPHRLVIAGDFANPDYVEKIQRQVVNSKFASDIFLLGYFPHESLPKLFAGAEAFIFPSDIEGVGLPVLEAMACGIPVLCSNKGALKEFAGTAPKYFNSADVFEIADLMQDVIENPKMREKMVLKGQKYAAGFDWKITAIKTLDLLKNLILCK